MEQILIQNDFTDWRDKARSLLVRHVEPRCVLWAEASAEGVLPHLAYAVAPSSASGGDSMPRVPRAFIQLAETVACHREPERWALLYRVLWRLTHGEPHLLEISTDDDTHALLMMEKAVRFDAHKMKAFVRFRKVVAGGSDEQYIAWHRPEHHVVKLTAPFFARRFAVMRWSILTPNVSAHWDGASLSFTPGVPRSEAPSADQLEELWRTYYASTFNPARVNVRAMKREMPARYWPTMPEAALIPDLLHEAPRRLAAMAKDAVAAPPGAQTFLPERRSLPMLRQSIVQCRGCELYRCATQPVFGEGPEDARCVLVGEQPGDQEDLAGRPFVGPAGQVLDEVLNEAGLNRKQLYVTNAVKHFKFEPRGQRRIHSKPNAREMAACKPWLLSELAALKPSMIVCLGATAAQTLMGPGFRILRERGKVFSNEYAPWVMATIHPSALLRIPDELLRAQMREQFRADLRLMASRLAEISVGA